MGTGPGVSDPPEWLASVPGDEDAEETLATGVAPWWLLQTRRQRQLALPVLVLAAGAAIAIVAAHPAGPRGSPTVAPSAVAEPSVTRLNPNLPAQCAHEISCISADAVPRGTSDAISASLIGAYERVTYTVTQRDTDQLVYRVVNATSRNTELLVIIRQTPLARSAATETIDPAPGAAIRYVRRQVGQYEVQIQYTGPPGHTPPIELAVRLSQDPRLLEVN
ncbi:MAG: hypothetical protein ABI775_03950 [Pseudonocardiales bacterium]|nr:hypothetical protein [Actinomycetota bacterium]